MVLCQTILYLLITTFVVFDYCSQCITIIENNMSNINIINARGADVESISNLTKDLFDMYREIDNNYTDLSDKENFKDLVTQIHLNISDYLVAIDDGVVIGFLHGKIDRKAKVAYLVNVFVSEIYRGAGLGTKFFEKFKEECLSTGVTRINLLSDIRSEAYSVWIKKGFVPFAHRMYLEI